MRQVKSRGLGWDPPTPNHEEKQIHGEPDCGEPVKGISDAELLKRLSAIQTEAFVAVVAKELSDARKEGNAALVAEIHARFTYRMHD